MADTTVKFLHSAMTGAPVLTGQAASLVALLDACLVNGFGSGTVDSVVIASGVATVTRAAGHPFEVGAVSLIAGATVSGGSINGEQKVLSATATTYTFDATGISDQTATGTITHKISPLGWSKAYSGTSLGAYKSVAAGATGFYLRVDDTGTTVARVVGYETMTDVNTGTAPFPTSTQLSGGGYWSKSSTANGTARDWILVGDGLMFYFMCRPNTTNNSMSSVGFFGDFKKEGSTDAYNCAIHAQTSDTSSSTPGAGNGEFDYRSNTAATYLPRTYTGLGSPILGARYYGTFKANTTAYRSGDNSSDHIPFPNPSGGGMYVSEWSLTEVTSLVLRGTLPGYYACPQNIGVNVFANRDAITNVTGLTGRTLKAVLSNAGCAFFDITGPWR